MDNNNPTEWQVDVAEALIDKPDKVFISAIVIAEIEWVLESVFDCTRQEIYSVIHELANHTRFQFEDWPALNNALLDYSEYPTVDLSDCQTRPSIPVHAVHTPLKMKKNWGHCRWPQLLDLVGLEPHYLLQYGIVIHSLIIIFIGF